MRILTFSALIVAGTLLASLLQAAQPGTAQETTVRGQIVSADDPPVGIARVRITLAGAGVKAPSFFLSDERGQFQLTAPRTASLTFSKYGFLPVTTSVSAAAATQASSPTVTLTRSGVVTGRILDNEGEPVIGGGVRMWSIDSSPGTGGRSVVTTFSNDLGEFRIGGLAAGKYEISSYHDFDEQERLRMSDETREMMRGRVTTRTIGEAQALSGIVPLHVVSGAETDVTLRQTTRRPDSTFENHGSLSGTVVDEFGDPVARVRVRAWRQSGNPTMLARQTGAAAMTDDRGQFRLFHLPPGQYAIEASSVNQPAAASPGPVYYPGTSMIGLASLVPLERGESVGNLTILFLPSPLPAVHGVVLSAAGQPLSGIVGLMATTSANGVRLGARTTEAGADGTFAFSNVAPGEYVVRATSLRSGDPRASRLNMTTSAFGLQRIVVSDTNVGPVRIVTAPTATITGLVEFEGSSPASPPSPADFALRVTSADPERTPDSSQSLTTLPGMIKSDWTFEIHGMTGLTVLSLARAPTGWWLKAIRTPATQSPREPFDASTDTSIVVVMSNQSARVLGRVVENADAPGVPALILFPTDAREWRAGSPYVRQMRADSQRAFALNTVPPGEYFLAAVANTGLLLEDDDMATVLEALARVAKRITLKAGDQQQFDLRPVVLRR